MFTRSFHSARRRRVSQFLRAIRKVGRLAHETYRQNCYLLICGPDDKRVVQLLFICKFFAIDLPNTMIDRTEAQRLIRTRPGFFWLVDRPQYFDLHDPVHLVAFHPVEKAYVYGDERSAAEDAAFLWFDFWGFSPDDSYRGQATTRHGTCIWGERWTD